MRSRDGRLPGLRGAAGACAPFAAVLAVLAITGLLAQVVDLDRARVPKPPFEQLTIDTYPHGMSPKGQAALAEAVMGWLSLTVLLWVVAAALVVLCGGLLHHALAREPALRRRVLGSFVVLALASAATLGFVVANRGATLVGFKPLVATIGRIGPGFVTMAELNGGLAAVIGLLVLVSMCALLGARSHQGRPAAQMHATTTLMYAAAAFMAVWMAAATALYRLGASLLVDDYREAALGLAPMIGLMGGLYLSLLLACAYAAAAVWLQAVHARSARAGEAGADESPQRYLRAHWPKLAGLLVPLVPGAASALLQGLVQAHGGG